MELKKFIVQAKVHTYASDGEGGEKNLPDGCKELEYNKENFKYRDRYYGFDPFVGEEVVWQDGKFVWGMNYYGEILSDSISSKEMYGFLQKAMRLVSEDRPFRGPESFKDGDFEYFDENNGDIESFYGTEKIAHKGQEIYRLRYHGGTIQRRQSS